MSESKEIIVVSGLPRSGTSLMMQMLALGGIEPLTDEIRTADTDNPKGYFEFERVKKIREDKQWLPDARGKAVKMISQLLYDLPATECYRIIFMRRDIDEIIVSQEKMLQRRGQPVPERDAMKSAFARHLDKLLQWIPAQPFMSLLEVSYHDLLNARNDAVRPIAAFLPLPLNIDKSLSAIDTSLYRNREAASS
ncbi:MAG: sulfotransferase family protein [Planctomycetaceae bacterium]